MNRSAFLDIGWYCKWSPDGRWLACGRPDEVWVIDTHALILSPRRFFPGRGRVMGWWENPLRLVFRAYEDVADLYALDPESVWNPYDPPTPFITGQNLSRADASGGHWTGGYAAGNRDVWDGALIEHLDWHCGGDGEWSVILDEARAHIYARGIIQRSVTHGIVRDYAIVREGYCGCGYNGPPVLIGLESGEVTDACVTPWRKECEPVYSQGWVCTTTELPTPQVLVRPFGATDVIALPVDEGAIGCDFRAVGATGYVASWSGNGTLVIQSGVDLTQSRHKLDPLPEMLDPVGTIAVTPTDGPAPLTVTTTLTLTQGATTDVRFYGHRPDDTYARWGGANAYTASGVLDVKGAWTVFAKMQGKNGAVRDTPVVPVTVLPGQVIPPQPHGLMRGLVAGFDDPISDERLAWFVSQGVQSVRTGVGQTAADHAQIVAQLAKFPSITPYYSIRFGSLAELNRVPEGAAFEPGNEPNLTNIKPATYAAWANSIRGACAANSLTPYWCSISNLNKDGLNWLAEVLRLCPWMDHLSLHRYNYGEVPNVQASPWGNRANEMSELISIIGTRAFRVTEIGCLCGPRCYHTHTGFLGKTEKWAAITEQQQLDYVRAETALWAAMPMCEAVFYYQERSGVPSDYGFDAMYSTTDPGKHRKAWEVFRG